MYECIAVETEVISQTVNRRRLAHVSASLALSFSAILLQNNILSIFYSNLGHFQSSIKRTYYISSNVRMHSSRN